MILFLINFRKNATILLAKCQQNVESEFLSTVMPHRL